MNIVHAIDESLIHIVSGLHAEGASTGVSNKVPRPGILWIESKPIWEWNAHLSNCCRVSLCRVQLVRINFPSAMRSTSL